MSGARGSPATGSASHATPGHSTSWASTNNQSLEARLLQATQGNSTASPAFSSATPRAPGQGSPVSKMYQLGERFNQIYSDIERATEHKRDTEENKMALLRDGIVKIEKGVNAEIKRRQEADKGLQTMFDSRLAALEAKVDAQFKELNQAMMAGIEVLTRRMGLVEKEIAHEKEVRPKEVENSTAELVQHLEVLQNAFELEKIGRLEMEAQILKKQQEEIEDIRKQVNSETVSRDSGLNDLRREFDQTTSERSKNDEAFQRMVMEELRTLKQNLATEAQVRETSEEQIVRAVGDVIQRLQDGLHSLGTK